jgi:hypothetical protein
MDKIKKISNNNIMIEKHILDNPVPADLHITKYLAEGTQKVFYRSNYEGILLAKVDDQYWRGAFIDNVKKTRETNGNFPRIRRFIDRDYKLMFAVEDCGKTFREYLSGEKINTVTTGHLINFMCDLFNSCYRGYKKPIFPALLSRDNVSFNPSDGFRVIDIAFYSGYDNIFDYIKTEFQGRDTLNIPSYSIDPIIQTINSNRIIKAICVAPLSSFSESRNHRLQTFLKEHLANSSQLPLQA